MPGKANEINETQIKGMKNKSKRNEQSYLAANDPHQSYFAANDPHQDVPRCNYKVDKLVIYIPPMLRLKLLPLTVAYALFQTRTCCATKQTIQDNTQTNNTNEIRNKQNLSHVHVHVHVPHPHK